MSEQFERVHQRRFNWVWVLILLLILILLFLLWYFFLRAPAAPTAQEPEYFARNQIVITGPENEVVAVAQAAAAELGVELLRVDFQEQAVPPPFLQPSVEPAQQTSSSKPQEPGNAFARLAPPSLQAGGNVTALYRIVDDSQEQVTVAEVVAQIRLQAAGTDVLSDPNYVIGRPLVEIQGDPNCGEGFAASAPAGGSILSEFYNQWALDERAIALFATDSQNDQEPQRAVSARGAGVVVALFDTSPFDLQGLPVDFANMSVQHFEVAGVPDARDHGVFSASLVNVVAPESEIRLYRVLNETNHGDLVTLLRALDLLLQEWETTPGRPLVINLSLGIHLPPDGGESDDLTDVQTLERMLLRATELGAVVVAAAGNDSAELFRQGDDPAEAQIPASYDFVIGVGASNVSGSRSCFSNAADVYAPGGDNDDQCMPVVNQCGNDPNHAACVIGYAVHVSPDTHYAYWNGTSFAAPLVSGQAALLLEAGVPPDQVQQHIIDTATPMLNSDGTQSTGGGIINVPASIP